MTHDGARQRGFALLIVLWTLALMALIGTYLLAAARQDTQLARILLNAATVEAAANGAMQQAIFKVLDSPGQRWVPDGSLHIVELGGATVAVRIENEAGKVNPNFASAALLRALLIHVGADPATSTTLARAIVQWREAGMPTGESITTADSAIADHGYPPEDRPDVITSLDELEAVPGMTAALLVRLRPHLTVFSNGDPDSSTHDPVVTRALSEVPQARRAGDDEQADVVSVTVDARGAEQERFAIRMIVELTPQAKGHLYRVLSYEKLMR
jgi:general secretion pathway protein K